MNNFLVKSESRPVRCEVCHQTDCFDPSNDSCSRCDGVERMVTKDRLVGLPVRLTLAGYAQADLYDRLSDTFLSALVAAPFFSWAALLFLGGMFQVFFRRPEFGLFFGFGCLFVGLVAFGAFVLVLGLRNARDVTRVAVGLSFCTVIGLAVFAFFLILWD